MKTKIYNFHNPVQKASATHVSFFPLNFEPRNSDVLIGKGKKVEQHVGNKILREILLLRLIEYSEAKNKDEKSEIISSIISQIRPDGAFIKLERQSRLWFDAGDFTAREKISRMFRDLLHTKYKSSAKNRKHVRAKKKQTMVNTEERHVNSNSISKDEYRKDSNVVWRRHSSAKNVIALGIQDLLEPIQKDAGDYEDCEQRAFDDIFKTTSLSTETKTKSNSNYTSHCISEKFEGSGQIDELEQLKELDTTQILDHISILDCDPSFSNPFAM